MKLFYYQRRDRASNFGDSLNPWLWNQLLPGIFDDEETTVFVGIGTLINNLLPRRLLPACQVVLFSSGVGYEKNLQAIPNSWTIYCVRGLLSAQKLGLSPKLAVADGAILVRRLFQPTGCKTHRFGFMPHIHHANYADTAWKSVCSDLGFKYIDPRWSVEQVLGAIAQTEVLLAEAMHGAIVADALRVPWIPLQTSARILTFKWQDWCSSIQVNYQPRYVTPLLDRYPPVAQGIRSSIQATGYWLKWLKQDKLHTLRKMGGNRQQLAAMQLVQIAENTQPTLSNEQTLEQLTVELEDRLHQFKIEVLAGLFNPRS